MSADRTILVRPKEVGRKPVFLSVDGGRAFSLRLGDEVIVKNAKCETELIRLSDKSIFEILRTKLSGELRHEE